MSRFIFVFLFVVSCSFVKEKEEESPPVSTPVPNKQASSVVVDEIHCKGSISELIKQNVCTVPKWLSEATTEGETVIITKENKIIWEDGTWKFGTWKGYRWKNGTWKGGTWKG
ncbi:MAG: hypothetical protein OXH36_02180, partial [Bdellovibrionales bacterium]|nr:hypothetical protein [Bdellovibrionales bacterium]